MYFFAKYRTCMTLSGFKFTSSLYMKRNISNRLSYSQSEISVSIEGDIGVCGIAVLANFSCGISVILILNCGIAVFSKPAGCVFFTFRSTIFGLKTYPSLFSDHL